MKTPDTKALQVARLVQEREQPELTILFGSRARGDHNEAWSDIDVMLVREDGCTSSEETAATAAAAVAARETYGRPVQVQLVWRTLRQFRHNRRYVNSIETNAVRDGVIMPRNSEEYGSCRYEDEETEYEYDWTPYHDRLEDAVNHLKSLNALAELDSDDQMIGIHAQGALEHGMKALLEAHQADYRRSHDIGELLGNIRRVVPEMADFRLSIDPDIYSQYAGRRGYARPEPSRRIKNQPDYLRLTANDAAFIIERARQARGET